ncbi:MAG: hypothetical protein ABI680_19625, partial [Chthoniobacteraceae bacterium]
RMLEIGDPALRRRTFDDMLWNVFRGPVNLGGGVTMGVWSESQQRAVREWVNASEVPADWKAPWRNQLEIGEQE